MKLLEEEIREFIRKYIDSLKILVAEKHQQIAAIGIRPSFPTEFPVKATVYFGRRGLFLNYDRANRFDISIERTEKPQKRSEWGDFILYPRFARIKDKPSEKAESDVKYLLSLPSMIEEHDREMQRDFEALWVEEMRYTAEHYVEYIQEAREVADKTKEVANEKIYHLATVVQNHLSNFEYVARAGCKALDRVYFMINSDLETSLFLALHGKYYAAMAILRKILEVHVRCAYLDSAQEEDEAERVLNNWIAGGKFPRRFGEIVNELIENRIDQDLTDLLKRLRVFENGSFKRSILSLYTELCKFVHLRPLVQWNDDMRLSFSEFDPDRWGGYYLTFVEVIKMTEILLILKFPRISSMQGLGDTTETYSGLQLSKQELEAIAQFSYSCASGE